MAAEHTTRPPQRADRLVEAIERRADAFDAETGHQDTTAHPDGDSADPAAEPTRD